MTPDAARAALDVLPEPPPEALLTPTEADLLEKAGTCLPQYDLIFDHKSLRAVRRLLARGFVEEGLQTFPRAERPLLVYRRTQTGTEAFEAWVLRAIAAGKRRPIAPPKKRRKA